MAGPKFDQSEVHRNTSARGSDLVDVLFFRYMALAAGAMLEVPMKREGAEAHDSTSARFTIAATIATNRRTRQRR